VNVQWVGPRACYWLTDVSSEDSLNLFLLEFSLNY